MGVPETHVLMTCHISISIENMNYVNVARSNYSLFQKKRFFNDFETVSISSKKHVCNTNCKISDDLGASK